MRSIWAISATNSDTAIAGRIPAIIPLSVAPTTSLDVPSAPLSRSGASVMAVATSPPLRAATKCGERME